MRDSVYVEGPSDKRALEELLRPLIETKAMEGVRILFFEAPSGDKKESVVTRVPQRAVSILRNNPEDIVVAMPDLHPKNKGCKHETPDELYAGIVAISKRALKKAGLNDVRIERRFKVFCFKYDLEALVLACDDALKLRLDTDNLKVSWRRPVEDQNDVRYPKIVLKELFEQHEHRYQETVDGPLILGLTGLDHIVEACPQCFKPFVEFLERLVPQPSTGNG
jgi:hypothetical protein